MTREPLYLLTTEDYRPVGAVTKEGTRYLGHDTRGGILFNVKDWHGMCQAAKRRALQVVSTAWYGL
jgi:hypothetical protein